MRKEVLLATLMAVSGCKYQGGLTTPSGDILYFNGAENNPIIIEHESCHLEKINEIGGVPFWQNYFTSETFRCEEEARCGFSDHPLCPSD